MVPDGKEDKSSRTLGQQRLVLGFLGDGLDILFVHVDLSQLGSDLFRRRDGGDGSGDSRHCDNKEEEGGGDEK